MLQKPPKQHYLPTHLHVQYNGGLSYRTTPINTSLKVTRMSYICIQKHSLHNQPKNNTGDL